ncbi:MAG: hypothetical protein H0X39_06290 [Actinobacteria bacterium]|nr:hypothetical protein [Actinomycetota bacterium]
MARVEAVRQAVAFARVDANAIPAARAAIATVLKHFVLHRRVTPLEGMTVWLEPVPHEEAVTVAPTRSNPGYLGGCDGELARAALLDDFLSASLR